MIYGYVLCSHISCSTNPQTLKLTFGQPARNGGDSEELDHDESESVIDSEVQDTEAPEITATRELMDNDEYEPAPNIFQIIKSCLEDLKKLDMPAAQRFKMMMHLTAVTQYVQLRERFCRNPNCKQPCLNASLAIACRMGKANGAYFACQIHHHENYLLCHLHLPLTKKGAKHGQYTLLDNESVLHSVRRYLAAQSLGTITPREFCHHVNKVILPALDLSKKKSCICERTAINWLKKLGYTCKDVKKGVYHDGHECPDVIEARKSSWIRWKNMNGEFPHIDVIVLTHATVKFYVQIWW